MVVGGGDGGVDGVGVGVDVTGVVRVCVGVGVGGVWVSVGLCGVRRLLRQSCH